MKPIGYYAGFLSQEDQETVTNATKAQLLDLMIDLSMNLSEDEPFRALQLDDFWTGIHSESPINKIALIRGLCDRIEQKLMEVAE